jgi:DNA-binding NtrC family response regulator
MHPIIKEFTSTSISLELIIEKFYRKDDFFENIFLEVVKTAIFKIEFDSSILNKIDQAIIKGHSDHDVYLLFINNSISIAWSHGQLEKAKILLSIGASISQEKIHPVIRALYIQAAAVLKFSEKKSIESLNLTKEAIDLIDQNNSRYRSLLTNHASNLAAHGKLNDLAEKESRIFNSPPPEFKALMTAEVKISNCIHVGDFNLGYKIVNEHQELFKKYKFNIQEYINLLNILAGDLDSNHYQGELIKLIVQIFHNVSIGRLEEAINFYKLYITTASQNSMEGTLNKYISINFELCMGNKIMARKMLEEKESTGDYHYLDDLFMARVQLLENNIEGAYQSFARLIKNVEHYGALNRVLFEIQFAKETKPADLFLLMNNWKNVEEIKPVKTKNILPAVVALKGVDLLIGNSFEINQVKMLVKKYAPLNEIILVTGETGTGKELIAKALHEEGNFSKEPFLAINCGALTDTLLESELFGYEAGSFTGALKQKKGIFEAAGRGTVFLDEFGEISPKLQVSLLRVLESNEIRMIGGSKNRKIECRIIVATNIELKRVVEEKKFREDLYFRLARLEIILPPLRERKKDLPDLVKYFLEGSSGISGNKKQVSKNFLTAFINYQWPGNIRELKNCMDRLKILNPEKDILDINELRFIKFDSATTLPKIITPLQGVTLSQDEKSGVNLHSDPILSLIHQSGLNPEQRIVYLKELFQKYKLLTRSQIMKITKVNPIAATKELQHLCDEGFIIRRTPSKSPRSVYFELNSIK